MASGAYTHAYTHTHAHTHTHTLADESDYKKPGAPATGRRAWFKKIDTTGMYEQTLSNIFMKSNGHYLPHYSEVLAIKETTTITEK